MKQIIPLQEYLNVIPKHDFKDPDFKGVKFQDVFNEFVRLGVKGARKRNNVLKDLLYYVELGFFVRLHNETNKQPIFSKKSTNSFCSSKVMYRACLISSNPNKIS